MVGTALRGEGERALPLAWSGKGLPAVEDGDETSEVGREAILLAKMTLSVA